MNLSGTLDKAASTLASAGVPNARVDAELLVGHVLGLSRGGVQAKVATNAALEAEDAVSIARLIERRAAREPLQHITGVAPFRNLELAVGPGVFVPRPESELVAQYAIDTLAATATAQPVAVDLGTGSGAIALALATEVPHAAVYGVEISPLAFIWATENRRRVRAENVVLILADLAGALRELDGTVDVVVSNPPYIPIGAVPRDPEVRLFDPELALYGGEDGLDVVRQVSITAKRLLRPGGQLILEHGELQARFISEILGHDGWRAIAHHRDLLGRDRATTAVR